MIHWFFEREHDAADHDEGRHHTHEDGASAPSGQRPCQSDDETARDWCRGVEDFGWPPKSFESSVVVLKAARLRHVRTFAST